MFEEYYAPLPDPEVYLNRIGASHDVCSLSDLDALILAHQKSVPFENLDPYYTRSSVSLAVADLYDKIVIRKRGGYCFEQNALFVSLLQALGYQAWSSDARVIRGKDLSSPILILHRVNLIQLEDGLYFCDVGYGGPMPSFALKVEDNSSRSCNGETFYIRKADGSWWKLGRMTAADAEEDLLLFRTEQVENCDFSVLSHYASTSPLSIFTQKRLLNRRLDNGSVSITDDTFTLTENGSSRTIHIKNDEQFFRLAEDYFGLTGIFQSPEHNR